MQAEGGAEDSVAMTESVLSDESSGQRVGTSSDTESVKDKNV